MDSASDSSWEFVYSSYSEFLNVAKTAIVEATALEQQEKWEQASRKLEALRKEVDYILDRIEQRDSCDLDDSFFTSATAAIDEVRILRIQILEHIATCNQRLYSIAESVAPPSYEEAMSTISSNGSDRRMEDIDGWTATTTNSLSYSELGAALENLKADTNSQSAQLVYSCENVTLYFISSTGNVSASNGPDTVRIFEIEDGCSNSLSKYYLQVFVFVYPLVPKVSPCIRTEFGAIVLPNINNDDAQETDIESIGLIVPRDQEGDFVACLENILQTKIVYCDTKAPESASARISDTIASGAECVSKFLVDAAQKAEEFLDGNTPKLIDKINPSPRERKISPCVSNGIRIAKDVTAVTAGITGFVVTRLGAATYSLGRYLAPHVKEKGSKILSRATGVDEKKASEKVEAVMNVTAGAVEGVGTVYKGLEQSARIFGRSLSNNTVQIVKHKYGHSAATFTQDTFETVGNGIEIGTHLRFFQPKTVAKTAARGMIARTNTNAERRSSNDKSSFSPQNRGSQEIAQPSLSPTPGTSRQDPFEILQSTVDSCPTLVPQSIVCPP